MSSKATAFLVVLDEPVHEYDAAKIQMALEQVRGVIKVEPVEYSPFGTGRAAAVRQNERWREELARVVERMAARA